MTKWTPLLHSCCYGIAFSFFSLLSSSYCLFLLPFFLVCHCSLFSFLHSFPSAATTHLVVSVFSVSIADDDDQVKIIHLSPNKKWSAAKGIVRDTDATEEEEERDEQEEEDEEEEKLIELDTCGRQHMGPRAETGDK